MVLPYQPIITLFEIGPFNITSWGLMVVLGFLVGLWIIQREGKRRGLDTDNIYDLALYILVGGILGARLGWFITEGLGSGFAQLFKIWDGGMVWHGGILGALLAAFIYIKIKKLNFWKYIDVVAIGVPLGHAIGRIGCYLAGYHLGKETTVPWAVNYMGQLLHPIPLYEIIALLGIFGLMFSLRKKKFFDGALFSIYILSYAVIRFFLDFLRADPTYFGLTVAQYTSIVLIIIFSIFLYNKKDVKNG